MGARSEATLLIVRKPRSHQGTAEGSPVAGRDGQVATVHAEVDRDNEGLVD